MVKVRIWDWPTRLFHWGLVLAIIGMVVTGQTGQMVWHFRLGQAVLLEHRPHRPVQHEDPLAEQLRQALQAGGAGEGRALGRDGHGRAECNPGFSTG